MFHLNVNNVKYSWVHEFINHPVPQHLGLTLNDYVLKRSDGEYDLVHVRPEAARRIFFTLFTAVQQLLSNENAFVGNDGDPLETEASDYIYELDTAEEASSEDDMIVIETADW